MDTSTDPLRKRGPRSAASLSVVSPDVILQRPDPPEQLTAEEKALWRSIVEKVRPGWFYSSEILLEAYVTTVTHQRQIEGFLKTAEPGSERWIELAKLHRCVVVTAANLATKLRLTPRSTVDRYAPKVVTSLPPGGKWPWEPGAELDDEPPAA